MLIIISSVNVFAASTYTDQETGVEISLPENWSEVPFLKERQYLDAKFMNSKKTAMITYSSYDIAQEAFSGMELDALRKYLNMSLLSVDDVKELWKEEGYSNIEKVTYNGVEYFKAELISTQTLNDQEYTVEQLQFSHFNNGWIYYFSMNKTTYYEYYDDFKFLIESIKYPNSGKINVDESLMQDNERAALSYYELFQQGPEVYVPILLIMLMITLVAYAMFPLIFAYKRKKIITKKKYNLLCYGINFLVMLFFVIINGKSSGSPYFLWTCVSTIMGTNILKRRQVLEGYQPLTPLVQDENTEETDKMNEKVRMCICRNCGRSIPNNGMFCHKCGTRIIKSDDGRV